MLVVSEDDLARGNGDGVFPTVEHDDQQWLPENGDFFTDMSKNKSVNKSYFLIVSYIFLSI